ncbi:MAG: transposase [Candidatus Heimdallarchaeota archaeon]|nr:transposase [Candidatus Heimdallarchaeota archaeon]
MRVQKNHLRENVEGFNTFRQLTRLTKNLYNDALYILRQEYFSNNRVISESALFHQVKILPSYQSLSSDNAQLTLRILRRNFSSFLALLRKKKQGLYKEKVHIPHYLKFNGHFQAEFITRQLKLEGDRIRISLGRRGAVSMGKRYIYVPVPRNIRDEKIINIRIIPRFQGSYYEIEYIYEPILSNPILDPSKFLSIDLGLNNFATAVSTEETAFILEGRGIKAYNQLWNKQKAKLQSIYDKQGVKLGRKMSRHHIKRYNVMRNFMAHQVNYIIQHCLKHDIGNIVVGDWEDMKRGLRMRRKVTQMLQQIPYKLFKDKLRSKCEDYGIIYKEIDESYSSQTCSNCGVVRKANRIHRGLYRCNSCGRQRNADINGAINIMRKVAPKMHNQWSSGDIISPNRVKLVNFTA